MRRKRRVRMAWLVPALLVLAGALPCAAAQPEATDEAETLARVVAEMSREVERLRGWQFETPVGTRLVTREEAVAHFETQLREQFGGERLELNVAFLKRVGLLPPDCDFMATARSILRNQVAGYYDPEAGTFHMIRGDPRLESPFVLKTIIVHELTHALDDQVIGIQPLMDRLGESEDFDLVLASLVEGSATTLQTRYMTQIQMKVLLGGGAGGETMRQFQEMMQEELKQSRPFMESPPYFQVLMAPYILGMRFLAKSSTTGPFVPQAGCGDALKAAMAALPASTEQVLHPHKYWDPARRDAPVTVDPKALGTLLAKAGCTPGFQTTAGELMCGLLAKPADRPLNLMASATAAYWTGPASAGWGGDRFVLAKAAKEDTAAKGLWVTAWDTPGDRDEFVKAYEAMRPMEDRRTVPVGNLGAAFLYGFGDAEAAALEKALTESPPTLTRDGKAWSWWLS